MVSLSLRVQAAFQPSQGFVFQFILPQAAVPHASVWSSASRMILSQHENLSPFLISLSMSDSQVPTGRTILR